MPNEPVKRIKPRPEIRQSSVKWNGTNFDQIREFTNGLAHMAKPNGEEYLVIEARSGPARADIGDQIVCGPVGAFYVCKADAYARKYMDAED